jgi:hypothetical protein
LYKIIFIVIKYKINHLKHNTMACGCKNKGNQTPPTPQQVQAQTQVQTESVKEAIKKTIDKYYTTNKTNGWVKE